VAFKKKILSQVDFAQLANVSTAAITNAIKTGRLRRDKKGKINSNTALAKAYIKSVKLRKASYANPPRLSAKDISESTKSIQSKSIVDIKRIQATTELTLLKIDTAKKLLISRDLVKKTFGKMSSIIRSYFHPLPDRLAEQVAAVMGIKDKKKILKARRLIEREVARSLEAFKRDSEKFVKKLK